MKIFLYRSFVFLAIISAFFITGLFLPTTPRAATSLFMASIKKDSLLASTKSPRLVLLGGSNVSFGFNSQLLKDSLHVNPINMGIHASIGLEYMMKSALTNIKKGDTVVLIPEYEHFYRDYDYASDALLRVVFDVNPSRVKYLSLKQMFDLIPYIPSYTLNKFNPKEYYNITEDTFYGVNSFNKYGDAYKHWTADKKSFFPDGKITDLYNPVIIKKIKEFEEKISQKQAVLFVSYPSYQYSSYKNRLGQIQKIEEAYYNNHLKILGSSTRYVLPDSLFFNTAYHLTKSGSEVRTKLFIEDFEKARLHQYQSVLPTKMRDKQE